MIKVKDVVFHQLSKLYFYCENQRMEKWMNMNPFYRIAKKEEVDSLPTLYFYKNK